ncbi:MAG: uroporphyrinogen-III synthase, partial [Sulfuricurvum sp.]|nr:uroporphyrinogen-III synthase [Sulfuricurvum sp.]
MRPVFLVSKTPYPGVIHIPVLSIRFLTPPIDFSQYDGIVFTSKQGIEALHNYDVEWKELQ